MSITVNDILKLPCLNGAAVVGGSGGLTKVISSVTVLEFSDANEQQREMLTNIDFYGSEMVITAFAHIRDDVEAQCENIRRLASVGEAGMILYYVGILLPRVDPALIELANQLDFVLIVMPENRWDLRYSEVISEVMEAIIKDQTAEITLLTDILEQMARLPEHQRTVDAVLRMARDRSHTSLILSDSRGRALGQANWPISQELKITDYNELDIMVQVSVSERRTVWRWPLLPGDAQSMELYLVKDGNSLSKEMVLQIVELVRLAVSLWSTNHADVQISELIRAILRDEPIKMRRLADLFHIDIASIHSMWVLQVENPEESQKQRLTELAATQFRELLQHRCDPIIVDTYEGYVVGFMAWLDKEENTTVASEQLLKALEGIEISASVVRCHYLEDTADVRRAFLMIKEYIDSAKRIWPTRQNYSLDEVEFAFQCRKTVDKGEAALSNAVKPLKMVRSYNEGVELLNTLCVYLLDANCSVTTCSERLFLHKNTIKYRIGRINACLGHPVDKEPEKYNIYRAAAIHRLIEEHI